MSLVEVAAARKLTTQTPGSLIAEVLSLQVNKLLGKHTCVTIPHRGHQARFQSLYCCLPVPHCGLFFSGIGRQQVHRGPGCGLYRYDELILLDKVSCELMSTAVSLSALFPPARHFHGHPPFPIPEHGFPLKPFLSSWGDRDTGLQRDGREE